MTGGARADAVLIAGPTASGKSALALDVARRMDGVIVNADSMQVYGALSILSARPSPEETREIEHRLYGHVDAAQTYSVAAWLEEARMALGEIRSAGKTAIFVGGTGLYFTALEEGLSPVPGIEDGIREFWRDVALRSPDRLHDELATRDPAAARELDAGDKQRLVRALEVIESTGRSILEWQRQGRAGGVLGDLVSERTLIEPDRAQLHARIERRVDEMIGAGAVGEVEALLARGLPGHLPVMRAIGVPQLAAHLRGEMTLEEAAERIKAATRQYAKRQSTWFRHQLGEGWQVVAV
ncbi:MAG: tRNA (adenosine(37)-N6)-dimethylallyltransferase MiaA [Hyphomicrobiales bacterium]|nr:tRNA (adenosine(37)-N6)-dimethylallyltransferase MiaA [Hyphomicrobiales bacterium]